MSLRDKKIIKIVKFILLSFLLYSCRINNKLNLSLEDLDNCQKWNWIALADTDLWSPKGEAYFTYVPDSNHTSKKLTKEELVLCGTWESIYLSSYFSEITKPYKIQYETSDIKGNIYFCRDGSGYVKNKSISIHKNIHFTYIFSFEWKLQNKNIYIKPVYLKEIEEDNEDYKEIETYEFLKAKNYCIGKMEIDKKFIIQVKNWSFTEIPIKDSFIYKKYGITTLGTDCLRYKYTWIEDWCMPVLQDYVKYNNEYTLKEIKSMELYK